MPNPWPVIPRRPGGPPSLRSQLVLLVGVALLPVLLFAGALTQRLHRQERAAVEHLLELHGGTIEASSDGLGRGSAFTARLPLLESAAVPQPARAASPAATARRRILVVEDNADGRAALRQLLELLGHEVYEAADGTEAVVAAAALQPDVAVVDIGLPGLDGHEVARRLRAMAGGRAMVLAALTGYGQPQDRRRAGEAGFDAYLVKPADAAMLAAVVGQPARASTAAGR